MEYREKLKQCTSIGGPALTDEEGVGEWLKRLDQYEDGVMAYMFDQLAKTPSHLACNVKMHDYGLVDVNDTFAVCGKAHSAGSSMEDEKNKTYIGMF